ncbi:MAG: S1 RNA-binding domain-containing protein [Lachnospiraceae bacterium]|nr:S1 RNA-binding domain-containing protein [Lachnospiraceae bacterium]
MSEKKNLETMDDYAAELEDSLKRIHAGDVMDATVVAFDEEGVTVDLNYYAPGKIPADEMSADPTFSCMSDVNIGDQFKAVVTQGDDGGGNIVLSKKEADQEYAWEKLKTMMDEKTLITGKIAGVSRAGATMYVEGIRGFIPASKLDVRYVEDTEPYLGKTVNVLISDVDTEGKRLILSAKELLMEAAIQRRNKGVSNLKVGTVVKGTVETLKDYGAFVNIGNDLSGLLHVSEISDKRIKHPKAVLAPGQQVDVMITKIENGKISLSMKAVRDAKAQEIEDEASEYKSEYVPNNPFAELMKGMKF